MSKTEIKLVNYVNDVEYEHFDQDPDGDEMRAGDGLYYKLPGEDGWSGVYHSQEEAEEDARHTLFYGEIEAISKELEADGYFLLRSDDAGQQFVLKAKDRAFEILINDDVITYGERFRSGVEASLKTMGKIEFDNGQETFGHQHRAARQAAEAIAAELGFHYSNVPRQVYDENAVTAMLVHETVREMNAPDTPAPQGLSKWIASMGSMELRFQCLKLAEEIDALYATFTEFELDGVAFDEEFVPSVIFHAYDFSEADENTIPVLDGGTKKALAFIKQHYDIEDENDDENDHTSGPKI
jgi:hypothetical protein